MDSATSSGLIGHRSIRLVVEMNTYYIIEHPTRGMVSALRYDVWPYVIPTVQFIRAENRTDERVLRFPTLEDAISAHDKILNLGNRKFQECEIRRSDVAWKFYCRECGGWIKTKYGHMFGHQPGCPAR